MVENRYFFKNSLPRENNEACLSKILCKNCSFTCNGHQQSHIQPELLLWAERRAEHPPSSQGRWPWEKKSPGLTHKTQHNLKIWLCEVSWEDMTLWKWNKTPVFLNSKLLDFAFDSLSRCLQDDALQKQEVILVKHLLLLQWPYDLQIRDTEMLIKLL